MAAAMVALARRDCRSLAGRAGRLGGAPSALCAVLGGLLLAASVLSCTAPGGVKVTVDACVETHDQMSQQTTTCVGKSPTPYP